MKNGLVALLAGMCLEEFEGGGGQPGLCLGGGGGCKKLLLVKAVLGLDHSGVEFEMKATVIVSKYQLQAKKSAEG